jgi:hypothetical protein
MSYLTKLRRIIVIQEPLAVIKFLVRILIIPERLYQQDVV